MPLEIKYKEPVDRPIDEIIFSHNKVKTSAYFGPNGTIWLENNYDGMSITNGFPLDDFKQWAAAIYKFSQEI